MLDDNTPNGTPEPAGDNGRPDAAPCRECEKLRREVAELRADKSALMHSMRRHVWGDKEIEIDHDALVKECEGQPSFAELIAELEARGE